ncbi:aldehyde dehydrogenase family protein [Streptomyces alkaliphilus]|uniref:Aldehyde dehydrogenase family protein n=2 Tax=Streptomyces alkaliphilus TaxID=1472722 RepID=A0A7W3TF90_9ACTN|nr:aldehyde dehydrogenase family protein [Streptomyces alkaliphilus]
MRDIDHLWIDGTRTTPLEGTVEERTHPADGSPTGRVVMGGAADVDRAVTAADRAFDHWSRTTPEERIALLENLLVEFDRRADDLADAVTEDMGAPVTLARGAHVPSGRTQIAGAIEAARAHAFEERRGNTVIRHEPLGPAALITPWNFPVLQMAGKTASALAAGCTVVLKPAESAARSAEVFAEVVHAAGTPAGVFNLVHGHGAVVGSALAAHPGIGVVSFTGSLTTAVRVTTAAAPTMKRVLTELGGKSPQILLPDADFDVAVGAVHRWMMAMTGQLCSAPSRTLVPRARMEEFLSVLVPSLEALTVGDPRDPATDMGPLVSEAQWNTVQGWIRRGLAEGARAVTGGPGKPEVAGGLEAGHYVRPTVLVDVTNDMAVAREEIFGPVMSVIPHDTVEEAIAIANDTPYGLAAYVVGADRERVEEVASRVRAGAVLLNDAELDWTAPWGGYKQSGNGREFGVEGMLGFLETKVIHGG